MIFHDNNQAQESNKFHLVKNLSRLVIKSIIINSVWASFEETSSYKFRAKRTQRLLASKSSKNKTFKIRQNEEGKW